MLKRTSSMICQTLLCLSWLGSSALAQTNPELGDNSATVLPPAPAPSTMTSDSSMTTTDTSSSTDTSTSTTTNSGDHAMMVGHLGVGAFGVLQLPVMSCVGVTGTVSTIVPGGCMPTDTGGASALSAPTIGARYWLDSAMAIEAAIGIGYSSANNKIENGPTTTVNAPSLFGLALHGGLPLVFAASNHFAFEVVPELNVGFVTGGWDDTRNVNTDADLSGFLLQLGGRVGAEVHFGFIDIPQLALMGSVGLHMTYEGRSASAGGTTVSSHRFGIGTTIQGEPWDIFTGNIGAIYYF